LQFSRGFGSQLQILTKKTQVLKISILSLNLLKNAEFPAVSNFVFLDENFFAITRKFFVQLK